MKTPRKAKPLRQFNENKRTFRFVIRKYVIARSVQQALDNEHKAPVHEIFVSDQ